MQYQDGPYLLLCSFVLSPIDLISECRQPSEEQRRFGCSVGQVDGHTERPFAQPPPHNLKVASNMADSSDDPFACFGEDDEPTQSDAHSEDPFACFGGDGDGESDVVKTNISNSTNDSKVGPALQAQRLRQMLSILLASRGIIQGVKHVDKIFEEETDMKVIKKRVEGEKKLFGGQELSGKKLGVIGLGHIGASVAESALSLGMDVRRNAACAPTSGSCNA